MGIRIDKQNLLFYLETAGSSYQMKVNENGVLLHQYYGKKIEMTDLDYLLQYGDIGFSGNPYDSEMNRTFSLDNRPQEYTSSGVGDFRIGSIDLRADNGSDGLDLRYQSHKVSAGKYRIPGQPAMYGGEADADTLELYLEDTTLGIEAVLYYSVWEAYDIITRAVKIRNCSEVSVQLEKAASLCLDFPHGSWEMMHFHGRHLMERMPERVPLMHGVQSVGSVRGASSHQHNPFIVLCDPQCGEDQGECYGLSLVYSGNFEAAVEVDQLDQTRIIMGIHSQRFCWQLGAGEEFDAPEAVMCFSDSGFGQMSRKLHKAFREHLCRGKYRYERKPVLLNNWEATYHDFDQDKLFEIAQGAAELGVEMLVMDDGWFGNRNSDCTGLGDWDVNTAKLKGGLRPLVEKVNELGLKFGIWFEPEMISEDSDLYRAHPEWALQMPGRKPNRSRYQLVLDMTRADVRQYLFEKICAVLDSANVEYVKWDFNRSISDVYSNAFRAEQQGEISHRYVLGLYDLLEKINARYPDLLLEGCSGGGGRFDPAMLYYSPQIWCSDDTDAVERIKIQYGTSFGYPISSVGSHVSAVPNHQIGRYTSMETRAVAAMAGSFGYELDLNTLNDEEKDAVKEQIIRYKKYYDLIQKGEYYRLNDPLNEPDYAAWQYASTDQKKALVHGIQIRPRVNQKQLSFKWKGLASEKRYQVQPLGITLPGNVLMNAGMLIPDMKDDYQPFEFYAEEI